MAKNDFAFAVYFDECAKRRESADDVFRIALMRAERSFRRCYADGFSEDDEIDYNFLADLIHGIRLADSMDDAFDAIRATGTKLPDYAEAVLAVFSALDVRNDIELVR